jgi:hypothetical protein
MKSLKQTVQEAEPIVGRISSPINVRALANRFQLRLSPISLKTLVETPSKPEHLILESGELNADTVRGWAQLGISSDGFWSFRGHVHEDGFVGHNYAFTVALEFIDLSGNVPIFSQEGGLGGTVDPFDSRDEDWQQDGQSSMFNQNWETIRSQGIRTNLHVATDPFQVVETVFLPLIAAVVAIGFILFASDSDTKCEWQPTPDNQGGAGVDYKCRKEFN